MNHLPTTNPPPTVPLPQAAITQADASATYTRYVPPSSKIRSQNESQSASSSISSPKRKREDVDHLKDSKPKKIQKHDPAPAYDEGKGSLKKPKKKPIHERAEDNTTVSDQDPEDEDSKHKSLLSKRDKSIKKAEKLAKKAAAEAAETGIGNEQEESEEQPELHSLEPLPQPDPVPETLGKPTFSVLPDWLASPSRISPSTTADFEDFGIPPSAISVLRAKGFARAFALQAGVLPLLLPIQSENRKRGDVVVSAATGSGKTLAYVLPMVENVSRTTVPRLRGLIVMPTRELVSQAREVCEACAAAYSSAKRRHVKIGIAVGNQTLKSEQSSLINEELRYDIEEYRKQEQRLNSKWESSSQKTHNNVENEDFNIYDEETVSRLPGHVIEYTPKVDILICTPGRLVEHLKSTPGFTLDHLKWLVIDEADKLLDQSFQQWLPNVMMRLPNQNGNTINTNHHVTKVILSATVTRDVGQLNDLKLYRPTLIVLEGSESLEIGTSEQQFDDVLSLPATLHEFAVKVADDGDKPLYLLHLIRDTLQTTERAVQIAVDDVSSQSSQSSQSGSRSASPSSQSSSEVLTAELTLQQRNETTDRNGLNSRASQSRGILIFTKSNEAAVRLGRLISILEPAFSTEIGILTSTIPHSTRKGTLSSFHAGKLSLLFASDLVARGLDLPNLAHVINYDLPTSLTSYIHRVGRTARAGKDGNASTLFTTTEARWFWNDIARTSKVRRAAGKVARVNLDQSLFDSTYRERYEAALATLGEEAGTA